LFEYSRKLRIKYQNNYFYHKKWNKSPLPSSSLILLKSNNRLCISRNTLLFMHSIRHFSYFLSLLSTLITLLVRLFFSKPLSSNSNNNKLFYARLQWVASNSIHSHNSPSINNKLIHYYNKLSKSNKTKIHWFMKRTSKNQCFPHILLALPNYQKTIQWRRIPFRKISKTILKRPSK